MDIKSLLEQSIAVKQLMLADRYIDIITKIGNRMIETLRAGKKILVAGNGGSAADAQHFAAELAGRFVIERPGLPVIALTTNTSIITAVGNDFSYDQVFARQVEAYGTPGDIFIGITTSGNSKNILDAFSISKQRRIATIGLLGRDGGLAKPLCDIALIVPSYNIQYIQEVHITIIHVLSAIIDNAYADISHKTSFSLLKDANAISEDQNHPHKYE